MISIVVFQQTPKIHLFVKQCPKCVIKYMSTNSKDDDIKEKIKMKTPIGNIK